MNDDQLLRYSRQIMLPQFDIEGQAQLLKSHALIIGMGGLGSPVAMYLAAAGVGQLTLADFDNVDLSNLQRQIAHGQTDIGSPKVDSAAATLRALNPEIKIETINQKLNDSDLTQAIAQADVVIDACDNFATRFAINQACVETGTPLVSGAAIRLEGQVTVFPNSSENNPCYRCLYDDNPQTGADSNSSSWTNCSESGVLAPVVGIIGSIQATEAIKVLTGLGSTLTGRLLILDASTMEFREMRFKQDPHCPVCASKHATYH